MSRSVGYESVMLVSPEQVGPVRWWRGGQPRAGSEGVLCHLAEAENMSGSAPHIRARAARIRAVESSRGLLDVDSDAAQTRLVALLDLSTAEVFLDPAGLDGAQDSELLEWLRRQVESSEIVEMLDAARRLRIAESGPNLRATLDRCGWAPGHDIDRTTLMPADPEVVLWVDGRCYFANEFFCITPDCACRRLGVSFVRLMANGDLEPVASVTLDPNSNEVRSSKGSSATALFEAYLARDGARRGLETLWQRACDLGARVVRDDHHRSEYRPTPKIGRNVPCPCGSGLKYKRCCLGKEKPSAGAPPARGSLPANRAGAKAAMALSEFVSERLGGAEYESALHDFHEGLPTRFLGPDDPETQCFAGWMFYHRATRHGRTIAELYLREHDLDDDVGAYIRAALGAPYGIYQVRSARSGIVEVEDLARPGNTVRVDDPEGARALRAGQLILTKVVTLGSKSAFEGAWGESVGGEHRQALLDQTSKWREASTIHRLAWSDDLIKVFRKALI